MSEDVEKLIRCVVLGIIGIICVAGNALVLRTIFCYKQPRVPIYIIICGLAIADLVKVCFEIPQYVVSWTKQGHILSEAWCKVDIYLVSTCTYVIAYHLVGLSIVRCILLTDRAHTRTYVLHAILSSVIIWIVMLLANIPAFTTSTKYILDEENQDCVSSESESDKSFWLRTAFSYILPLVVIAAMYVVTHLFSKRFVEESYSRREIRLSRMVTCLIIVFAICRLPYEIVSYLLLYKSHQMEARLNENDASEDNLFLLYYKVLDYVEVFTLVDLAIRPIIYAKLSWYFSASFDEIINCIPCREKSAQRRISRQRSSRMRVDSQPSQTPLTLEVEDYAGVEDPCAIEVVNVEAG